MLLSLPETTRIPSARYFAECIISSTRQSLHLPSASQKALGKNLTLGKINVCRVPLIRHSAKSIFAECLWWDTRQTSSHALHAPVPVGWRSGRYCLPNAGYGTLGKPRFYKCLTVNTRQTMSRAPHTTVTTTVTPLPRPVPVTTSVTVTSCRVRGVGHSATFCQCRVHYAGTRHRVTFAECLFWLSAKLEKNIFIYPPNFFLCYYSMWWTSYIILVNYPWSLPYLHYLFH